MDLKTLGQRRPKLAITVAFLVAFAFFSPLAGCVFVIAKAANDAGL